MTQGFVIGVKTAVYSFELTDHGTAIVGGNCKKVFEVSLIPGKTQVKELFSGTLPFKKAVVTV